MHFLLLDHPQPKSISKDCWDKTGSSHFVVSSQYFQQFYYTPPMNILSAEQMKEIEQLFATLPLDPVYRLRLPTEREYQNMSTFQTRIFPIAGPAVQRAAQKMITLAENMRSLPQLQPNAVFHMLTYTLMNILYQDKYSSTNDCENNYFLLQTIKCSLYSKDVDLKLIKNVPFSYETKQLKLMAYQFFSFMEQPSLSQDQQEQARTMDFDAQSYAVVDFHPVFKTDPCQDRRVVNNEEAVTNLIEYFDLHYRSLGELILFYQDVQREIVVGEYYENESEKQTQKQQLQYKSSVKLNMIESFLVNVNDKNEKGETSGHNKKKGIVESDVKLFNFMLENSSEDEREQSNNQKERENEIETPHFKDGSEQFHFWKKKKSREFKPEEVRNEFQRLIMDQSHTYSQEEDVAPTPYLGGENQFAFTANHFASKQLNSTQVIDSPIDELNAVQSGQNPFKENNRNELEHSGLRKTAEESEKYLMMFTGAVSQQTKEKKQLTASLYTEKIGFQRQYNAKDWTQMSSCGCRKAKLMRNCVNSKVVQLSVIPQRSYNRNGYLSSVVSPRVINHYKPSYEKKEYNEHVYKHKEKETAKREEKNYMERKPAFLKNLKKNKLESTLQQDFTKSLVNQSKKYEESMQKQTSHERIRYNKFKSCVEEMPDNNYSRSVPKFYEHKSVKTISELGEREKVNEQIEQMNTYRPGVKKTWQTNSNFIQKVPEYSKISKVKISQMSTPNGGVSSASPLKFFAPVQIIAPTVYVNSSNPKSPGNIVLKLNDINSKMNPEAKSNDRQFVNKGKTSGVSPLKMNERGGNVREGGCYGKQF